LILQTTDCDDVLYETVLSLPTLEFSTQDPQRRVVAFCRTGKTDATITVTIRAPTGTTPPLVVDALGLEPTSYLYVTLGPKFPNLRLPSHDQQGTRFAEVGAWVSSSDLPTRWLGYDTIDVAILGTSQAAFFNELVLDSRRRSALLEWVRRGGKIVLCVGQNQNLMQSSEEWQRFLPVEFTGMKQTNRANVQWPGSAVLDDLADPVRKQPLAIATMKFKPERDVRTLATARLEEGGEMPLVVQAAYGSGRVTIVAADPDEVPFSRWKRQGDFWERVLRDGGPKFAMPNRSDGLVASETNDSLARNLQSSLESLPQVPVISFSWIALLVLVYIVLIGPLDYLILKKIFKRLEWTWVTFPTIVLVASLGAYWTAHRLKGSEIRIQKVDLVDFDLIEHSATGWSWFSVFSPSQSDFHLSIEPSAAWRLKEPVSPPDLTALGEARVGRQSLFRRSYRFDADAGSLHDVPISVWSVKSLQARWHSWLERSDLPLDVSLRLVGDEVTGRITSRLPVRLHGVTVFHRQHVYQVGILEPGQTVQVTPAARTSFREWSSPNMAVIPLAGEGQFTPWTRPAAPPPAPASRIAQALLFHEFREAGSTIAATPRNAGFRDIDQSWRLSLEDPGAAAIIYAQTDPIRGSSEEITASDASVCRLRWSLSPTPQTEAFDGLLSQETHLRFFVPVRIIR
jgi:hypothetical protein